jgi:hypothetical protein
LWFTEAGAFDDFSFGFPLELEVGFWVEECVFWPLELFKFLKCFHLFFDPLEVFWVVSLEAKFPTGFECFVEGVEETLLDEAVLVVACLWPRIWAEKMEAIDGVLREKPLNHIFRLEA